MAAFVLGCREVEHLLDMPGLLEVMERTLRELSRGDWAVPQRQMLSHPSEDGLIAWMPAVLPAGGLFGSKLVSVYPGNRELGLYSHQGVVVLFHPQSGEVRAVVDAAAITARRTAAVSAVATRLLALPAAGELALLGSGTLAETHLAAMLAVRPLRRVRVWSRAETHARAFAQKMTGRYAVAVDVCRHAREAVVGADIVCSLTDATSPVLKGAWLKPGAHLNAVGASVPGRRELDDAAVQRARVFVDFRAAALAQADDVRLPLQEGAIARGHILGEIGEVAAGMVPGRTSGEDVTLFKSVGLAVEDLAAAAYCLAQAEAMEIGQQVEFGGRR